MDKKEIYHIKNLKKQFRDGDGQAFDVLDIKEFVCNEGDFIGITGASGSGKTTLLNVLGLLDGFQSGELHLLDNDIHQLSEKEKSKIRNRSIGFVLQNYGLIDDFTVQENIFLPTQYLSSKERKTAQSRIKPVIEKLGIDNLLKKMPNKLSGGQKQRVAIARALVNEPAVILADEPSGNLDEENSQRVLEIFFDQWQSGKTIILISHEDEMLVHCNKIVKLVDGKM